MHKINTKLTNKTNTIHFYIISIIWEFMINLHQFYGPLISRLYFSENFPMDFNLSGLPQPNKLKKGGKEDNFGLKKRTKEDIVG